MDNREKKTFIVTNQYSTDIISNSIQYNEIQLGYYKNRGRVAKVKAQSLYLKGLQDNPQETDNGQAAFDLMNWLLNKPRLPGDKHASYLLSTLPESELSGFNFNKNHNLWIDETRIKQTWRDNEIRSSSQIVDMLQPSGQWHRHYGTILLSSDANNLQVMIIRHWLELNGGGLLIIEDDTKEMSSHIQQLLSELEMIKPAIISEKKPGLLVKGYPHDKNIEHSTSLLPGLATLNHRPADLSTPTDWIYEGILTVPNDEMTIIYLDAANYSDDLLLELGQHSIFINKDESFGEIILENAKAGQQLPFRITTTTQGKSPQIRLGWGFPSVGEIETIPDSAIHHTQGSLFDIPAPFPPSTPTETIFTTSAKFNPDGYEQVISLPSVSINSFALTEETRNNSHYFTMVFTLSSQNVPLRLDNIEISPQTSWHTLASEIEAKANQQLAVHDLAPISIRYSTGKLLIHSEDLSISQFQLKNQNLHPILITENYNEANNKLVVGAIHGSLPNHEDIAYYELLEQPLFGQVDVNRQTGQWLYQPDRQSTFQGHDQFDIVAMMKDGSVSRPMSIQLQSESAPQVAIPGQKIFTLPDPIYNQPNRTYHSVPHDMQLHKIQLAQTHLLSPDDNYFSLTANRWALLKVDITSHSAANAPDIIAIIKDKEGNLLEEITLTGPKKLPSEIPTTENKPSIEARDFHRNSYTAPIKGQWVQPEMQIQIMAGDIPLTQPYTDENGIFVPSVKTVAPIRAHITHTSMYREGHGTYDHSPLSWGLEAASKLPTHQFSLFSYPSLTHQPSVFPYNSENKKNDIDYSSLVHLLYDAPYTIQEPYTSQISWAYLHAKKDWPNSSLSSEFFYSAIKPFNIEGGTLGVIGLGSPKVGGGITSTAVMWHEIFGHGLSLPHTSSKTYPYSAKSNGEAIAFDQYRQQYTTYLDEDQHSEIMPAMYPANYPHYTEHYDAFLFHSAYFTHKAQAFLARFTQSDTPPNYLPVYQLHGTFLTQDDGSQHPYNQLRITETLGPLTQQSPYDMGYHLIATYATPTGLLTDTIEISLQYSELNINIPNKGELVSIDIIKDVDNTGSAVYQYKNPRSLANRMLINSNQHTLSENTQLDNYWQGSKLFWSFSEKSFALCAKWVDKGRLRQQYFSIETPLNRQVDTDENSYKPINHLEIPVNTQQTSPKEMNVTSNVRLLSDVHIYQEIDVRELGLSEHDTYWVTLSIYDEQGDIQEHTPLEAWYISVQDGNLTIRGAIDSTPDLKIAGIKIYIDSHLQDGIDASVIWFQQNTEGTLAENREFLNYDRPIVFNELISHIAGMREEQAELHYSPTVWSSPKHSVPLVA
ncbi:hypothetical protein [Providencia sp. PROV129]|uniref:hypothetical protein n=1 Tax=Providencia sp. PROV129 TaxID=2949839 RepID=UPI00234A6FEB|nr:hypothetical protein [Providencia sp. PROV129]